MRLTRDALGGICLVAIAGAVALGASRYHFGTLLRMGPGFYPILISGVLAAIGGALTISGFRGRHDDMAEDGSIEIELRTAIAVLASVLAFALTLERVGLVGSTFLLVSIAALAERQPKLLRTILLAAVLAAIAVAIFSQALGLNIPVFRWPF